MRTMPGMRDPARMADPSDTTSDMAGMPGMEKLAGMRMRTADPLGVSMDRMGSGTTWIPDAVSIPSYMTTAGAWDLMLHGFVFGQYDAQGGARGGHQLGSLNWGMFMASHALWGGRFQARTMLSFDAVTVSARGYPLLLQTGESYDGVPLHDRQHPHDLFMELGALYERPVTRTLGISLYAAPAGEPALGPVAFMHRPSAMDIPTAPIGHHWQDATHIAFGVLTAGVFGHAWKLEGSAFNGREPDQYRFNVDPLRLDSYAGRLTVNPSARWSLTAGYGYIHSPESVTPDESVHRLTASAIYGTRLGVDGQWASTVVWGANRYSTSAGLSQSVLVESDAVLDARNIVIGRAEIVGKNAEELTPDAGGVGSVGASADDVGGGGGPRYTVGAVSLGYVREVARWQGVTVGLGGMGTVNVVPASLRATYGSQTPLGGMVFVRLRPVWGRMSAMGGGTHDGHGR